MTNSTNKHKAINVTAATISSVDLVLGSIAELDKVLDKWVDAEGKAGKIQADFAVQMVDTFGAEWWAARGELGKAVKAAHGRFLEKMGKLGKTRGNMDKMWQRVKELCGYVTKGKAEAAAKATGGDVSTIDAKTIAELKTVYNRFTAAAETDAPLSYKIKTQLEEILDQLGVDI